MSHASPEFDFMSSPKVHHLPTPAIERLQRISFSSLKADLTCHPNTPDVEWNANYLFATPNADFHMLPLASHLVQSYTSILSDCPLYHQLIPHPESALGEVSVYHLMVSLPLDPIPLSVDKAMRDTCMVVISSPNKSFEMVNINNAWVDLCGYKQGEAIHGLLSMFQEQATNQSAPWHSHTRSSSRL